MKKLVVLIIAGLIVWSMCSLFYWAAVEIFGTGLPSGEDGVATKNIIVPLWDGSGSSCTIPKGTTITIGGISTVEQGQADLRVRLIQSDPCSGWPVDDLGLKRSLDVTP